MVTLFIDSSISKFQMLFVNIHMYDIQLVNIPNHLRTCEKRDKCFETFFQTTER